MPRQGPTGRGAARLGKARQGKASQAGRGLAWRGMAGRGAATPASVHVGLLTASGPAYALQFTLSEEADK